MAMAKTSKTTGGATLLPLTPSPRHHPNIIMENGTTSAQKRESVVVREESSPGLEMPAKFRRAPLSSGNLLSSVRQRDSCSKNSRRKST